MANAIVQVMNAARMLAIEAGAIIGGVVKSNGHLELSRFDGQKVDAGPVRGTLWGFTPSFVYDNLTNHPISFPPGVTPLVGDLVVSTHDWTKGTVYRLTQVHSPTLADVEYHTSIRGETGAAATGLSAYPVGAIYISVDTTSPATLFGGTWAVFATGRCLIGVDTGQTEFNTVEKTGGAKTHLLTGAQSGTSIHSHGITQSPHAHNMGADTGYTASFGTYDAAARPYGFPISIPYVGYGPMGSAAQNANISINNSAAANASQSHPILDPYVTVYMWKRTA